MYRNFGNTYNLYHAPKGAQVPENWERITRKEALHKARNADEFGSSLILPFDITENDYIYDNRRFAITDHIVSRIR